MSEKFKLYPKIPSCQQLEKDAQVDEDNEEEEYEPDDEEENNQDENVRCPNP